MVAASPPEVMAAASDGNWGRAKQWALRRGLDSLTAVADWGADGHMVHVLNAYLSLEKAVGDPANFDTASAMDLYKTIYTQPIFSQRVFSGVSRHIRDAVILTFVENIGDYCDKEHFKTVIETVFGSASVPEEQETWEKAWAQLHMSYQLLFCSVPGFTQKSYILIT